MWLWICLMTSVLFLIFWFWFGPRLIKENNLKKLFIKLILMVIMADCILTLTGQPVRYWQSYSSCDELAIIGEKLLQLHPLAFVVGIIFWIGLITFLIKKLDFFLSSFIFFSVFIGHSMGFWQGRLESQLKPVFEDIIRKSIGETIYEEISGYLLYLFIGVIFAYILNKIWKNKSA